jgi:Copper amine oxidase N-terminal domain./KWG Leptospira.
MIKNYRKISILIIITIIMQFISFEPVYPPIKVRAYEDKLNNVVILNIGSSDAFINNIRTKINYSAPDLVPYTKDDRAMIPLRFVSECFGGSVSWDESSSIATIYIGEKVVKIPMNMKTMYVNDIPVSMDVPAEINNESSFIPLRKFVEDVLGKNILYDNGLIIISNKENSSDYEAEKNFAEEVRSWFPENNTYLYCFEENEKYGYINKNGQVVIKPQYDFASNFSEGLACVEKDGILSYIDCNGNVQFNVKCDGVGDFCQGRTWLRYGSITSPGIKYSLIDRSGKTISSEKFDGAREFSNGLAAISTNEKKGYINFAGDLVIRLQDYPSHDFHEGMARMGINGNEGYIDTKGILAINKKFDYAFDFSEGLALVKENGVWSYIDKEGKTIIKITSASGAVSFSEGMAGIIINDKCGFINKTGEIIISPQFDFFWNFNEGLAAVMIGKKWGYIDKHGNIVIKPQFDSVENFKNGLANVKIRDQHLYIDHSGNTVFTY